MRYLNPIEDEEHIKKIMDIYNAALSVLFSYKDGILNYDILSYMFGIKFEDLDQDLKVLDFVCNNSSIFNPGYVYVSNDAESVLACIYKNDKNYQFRYKDGFASRVRTITNVHDISDNYISLSKILSNAKYIGKKGRTRFGDYVDVLYRYKDKCIILDCSNNLSIELVENVRLFDRDIIMIDYYKDLKNILNMISEIVKEDLPYKSNIVKKYIKKA
jgi:hypothetical protein